MKAKSSVLTIRVPKELKHKIERVADEQGVSINQLALYAFTKEIKELETSSYFNSLLKSKSKKELFDDFDTVMKKVKSTKVPKWDML
ncbi:MAG TPA: toxin-antitoxin system HicB family antitoxin [Spirochaetota bacterium]|nr:toxin-antitoxin system HicB family antitoxin [Spirochaetota bacterium]HQO04302.1 toxin-antitoxin system HicB family antitoxin [Spirochaetota bacterium]